VCKITHHFHTDKAFPHLHDVPTSLPTNTTPHHTTPQYQNYKLIYRRYAGLYFSMGVDVADNELAYLESIHLFVELLDEFFRNVCELDIVFNFNKVGQAVCAYLCVDLFFVHGGMSVGGLVGWSVCGRTR
jgi:AP-2 complex subunit sigma-1